MTKVVLLGAGNLAYHLFQVINNTNSVEVIQVYNHQSEKLKQFEGTTAITTDKDQIKEADIYLISVKDDAIPEVASILISKEGLVVHTAGAVTINALSKNTNFGVFYPLQSFSKNKKVDFKEIPICIEANSKENLSKLKILASKLTNLVYEISSEQRQVLHVAAVFANNFSNHMLATADSICAKNEIPFEILKPLIAETFQKINSMAPKEAQTGPAIRNDKKTMQKHLSYLTNDQKNIYKTLSESILKSNGKKL
ncbi:Rossmann-like and DUF2520 domain-containing protein [Zunongwangia sp.]|uniref:Rossmann-like and DUF2520 domain-containing protein n=1 Tax=Zunongwangia sp. TaxID=1965325 RepID=UPI003AA93080